jgi:hypothetical protein
MRREEAVFVKIWKADRLAIYLPDDQAVVLRATALDQDLAERTLETHCNVFSIKSLELSLSVWSYLDDPAALVKNNVSTFEEIRQVAGDTLRPLDSHLILTRSGNRATSMQQLASGEQVLKLPGSGRSAGDEGSGKRNYRRAGPGPGWTVG